MKQGMSNAAACRIVGVNRKTGHRWRYGRSITVRTGDIRTYPAITRPAHPVSARFLSEAERVAIADGLIRGQSIRVIAAELGRLSHMHLWTPGRLSCLFGIIGLT